MRIRSIRVEKLFGIFDHEIPLKDDERITIVYGPNGFGKTFTLSLVNELFSPLAVSYDELFRIPFGSVTVTFHGGGDLSVERRETGDAVVLVFSGKGRRGARKSFEVRENGGAVTEPKWLSGLKESVDVRFIHTERLARLDDDTWPYSFQTVNDFDGDIRTRIQEVLAEYAGLSQSLDRTFPVRLLKAGQPDLPLEDMKERFRCMEKKRGRLVRAGLVDSQDVDGDLLDLIDDSNSTVLAVYLEDTEKKLAVFDDFAEKIELLLGIVNARFNHKTVEISRREGFVVRTSDGRVLPPDMLSSGEQHLVVLLYELLFHVSPDSLILIDEPELSLHVVWQQEFIRDIEKVNLLAGFDAVVATHSPQIIHDRWNLAVELKDPRS